jgi:hypothetical protein
MKNKSFKIVSGIISRQDSPLNTPGSSGENTPVRKMMNSSSDLSNLHVFGSQNIALFSDQTRTFDNNYDNPLQGKNKAKRIVSAASQSIKNSPYMSYQNGKRINFIMVV